MSSSLKFEPLADLSLALGIKVCIYYIRRFKEEGWKYFSLYLFYINFMSKLKFSDLKKM